MEEHFYTAKQIAEKLGLHPRTVLTFFKQGKIPGLKIGRTWKATQADIDAYLEQQRQAARAPRRDL
jgi:excisionase family DNA binding protein